VSKLFLVGYLTQIDISVNKFSFLFNNCFWKIP